MKGMAMDGKVWNWAGKREQEERSLGKNQKQPVGSQCIQKRPKGDRFFLMQRRHMQGRRSHLYSPPALGLLPTSPSSQEGHETRSVPGMAGEPLQGSHIPRTTAEN